MKALLLITLLASLSLLNGAKASEELLKGNARILFLGDSITQAGTYVTNFDAWLVKKFPGRRYTVINGGVSSETISGLSEDGHAGGRFPRPDLHERLERVLEKSKPDLIIACYGMNCGIYKPLDEERFKAYRDGQIKLHEAAKKIDAEVVHVTPPIFDNHGKDGFDYDDVLTAYSAWLVKQRQQGWHVADLHSEMRAKVDEGKKKDPRLTVQRDRIHPNKAGHWMMTQSLISYFGDEESAALHNAGLLLPAERFKAVEVRMKLWQKAIHAETNPKRPGVPKGGSMESAAEGARELRPQIYGG